jgi:phospholipase/carboxylesterase
VGYGWFPLTLDAPPDVPAILAARDNLRLFLDACATRHPIDRRKLVVLGFSQGGVMAYGLALAAPERYSAVAVLSSWLPQEFVNTSPNIANSQYPPMLIQHGLHDELIEVDRARQSIETLRNLRIPVTYREYDMSHQISQRSLADLSAWLEDKVLSPIILAT